MHTLYLSLGSNLGDRRQALLTAIQCISDLIGPVVKQSSFIETEPWGFESDHTFMNACVEVSTSLAPLDVLSLTQQIERHMGRTHKSINCQYADRIIDIDILLYDDITLNTPELKIPHPHMLERDFVMIPLRELGVNL